MSSKYKKKSMKTVQCRTGCGNEMEISADSVSGMCWRCVNKMMRNPAGYIDHDSDGEDFEDHEISPKEEDE